MNKAGRRASVMNISYALVLIQYFKTNLCFHAVENTNILSWNERLSIAVDTAHGNVLFMAACFLYCAPLHCL